MKKTLMIVFVSLLMAASALGPTPTVRITTDRDQYAVGDLITATVTLTGNPGLHGLFFDVQFNADQLSFEDLQPGAVVTANTGRGELLWAQASGAAAVQRGGRVVVSFGMQGSQAGCFEDGAIATLTFKAQAAGSAATDLRLVDAGMLDRAGQSVPSACWVDSLPFHIRAAVANNTYIVISNPRQNQVFEPAATAVAAVYSYGAGYQVRLSNASAGYAPAAQAGQASGVLTAAAVPLAYGFNQIKAELLNADGQILASDSVRVFRSQADRFLRILSPSDHELLGTDMVNVRVSSSYPVIVNGLTAEARGEKDGTNDIYEARIWLRPGFNTINAVAASPEGANYAQTIQVYYRKDASLFGFLTPLEGSFYKPETGSLVVTGEIDSLYRPMAASPGETQQPNEVSLRVVFRPRNPNQDSRVLLASRLLSIREMPVGSAAQARYQFYNDFAIDLPADLGQGELVLTAWKNRQATSGAAEAEINRIVYIDDSRLAINLIQPNIFTQDSLDSASRFNLYAAGQALTQSGVVLGADGSLSLTATSVVTRSEQTASGQALSHVVDTARLPDGTLYALASFNETLTLYRRAATAEAWVKVLTQSGMYGYDLCVSGSSLLLGVSNMVNADDSGLYLLRDGNLVNLRFATSLRHVQFVEARNGRIYLYGNYFTNLYSFRLDLAVEQAGTLRVDQLEALPLLNNLALSQFSLSPDARSVLLRDTDGRVSACQLSGGLYRPVSLNLPEAYRAAVLVPGFYESGDYNAYVLVNAAKQAYVVMEHRFRPASFITTPVDLAAADWLNLTGDWSLRAVAFTADRFHFLIDQANRLEDHAGQVFFNSYIPVAGSPSNYPSAAAVQPGHLSAQVTPEGCILHGYGASSAGTGLDQTMQASFQRYDPLTPGRFAFTYANPEVEALTGFSFEVDAAWLATTAANVKLGFRLFRRADAGTINPASDSLVCQGGYEGSEPANLASLLSVPNPAFSVVRQTNDDTGRERISVEFAASVVADATSYLQFDLRLASPGAVSPVVANWRVAKKIQHLVTRQAGQTSLNLPLHGIIQDRTVSEVFINGSAVTLGRDGSFHYNLAIPANTSDYPVNLACSNASGQNASLAFKVRLVEALAGIGQVAYQDASLGWQDLGAELEQDSASLRLKGLAYGMNGAVVGYEIHTYPNAGGSEVSLLRQGLLTSGPAPNAAAAYSALGRTSDPGRDYRALAFEDSLALEPGRQQLRLYTENPGGARTYFQVADVFPVVNYNLPQAEQRIVFAVGEDLTTNETIGGVPVPVSSRLAVAVGEQGNRPVGPFSFSGSVEIRGQVVSLHKLEEVLVRSYTPGLTFGGSATEILVPVQAGNRFQLTANYTLQANEIAKSLYLGVIPAIPSLTGMGRALRIEARKDFADCYFAPDFAPLAPANWTPAQRASLSVPFELNFTRADLPLDPAQGDLLLEYSLNFGEVRRGRVQKILNNRYRLVDELSNQPLLLSNIKTGVNRLHWELLYRVAGSGQVVSVAMANRQAGLSDYLFTVPESASSAPTQIGFTPGLRSDVYYGANGLVLPALAVSKDPSTSLEVRLNGGLLWQDGMPGNLAALAISNPRQGLNQLTVRYQERGQAALSREYSFLYDSLAPQASLQGVSYAADNATLETISVLVHEANYQEAILHYGASIVSVLPELRRLDDATLQLTWSGLAARNLQPAADRLVSVEIRDRAGRIGQTGTESGLNASQQIGNDTPVEDVVFPLPVYTGTPVLPNESLYQSRDFPDHTKFAPSEFLRWNMAPRTANLLYNNSVRISLLDPDNDPSSEFGKYVACDGEWLIVSAPNANRSGGRRGKVYIYRKTGSSWLLHTTLPNIATDVDLFGQSIAVDGSTLMIGARDSVYVSNFSSNLWTMQASPLRASDHMVGNQFGKSLAFNGSTMVVGAPSASHYYTVEWTSGAVYIFEKNASGIWVESTKILPYNVKSPPSTYGSFGDRVVIGDGFFAVHAIITSVTIDEREIRNKNVTVYSDSAPFTRIKTINYGDTFIGYYPTLSQQNQLYITRTGYAPTSGLVQVYSAGFSGVNQTLLPSNSSGTNNFGNSIASTDNLLACSDPLNNKVYLFQHNTSNQWAESEIIQAMPGQTNFGRSIALSGNTIIIGFDGGVSIPTLSFFLTMKAELDNTVRNKYLVFSIPKNNGIPLFDSIDGKIKFQVYGVRRNNVTGDLSDTSPVTLSLTGGQQRYLETASHYYYIVEAAALSAQMTAAAQQLVAGNGYTFYDPACLRIIYSPVIPGSSILVEPDAVYLTGEKAAPASTWSDLSFHNRAYEAPVAATSDPRLLAENLLLTDAQRRFANGTATASNARTWSFWLRQEDEAAGHTIYSPYPERQFFALQDAANVPILRGFYQMFDEDTTRFTFHFPGQGALAAFSFDVPYALAPTDWQYLAIRVVNEGDDKTLTITVNNGSTVPDFSYDLRAYGDLAARLVAAGAQAVFGPASFGANTGFYAIAGARRSDRWLSDNDLLRQYNLRDRNTGSGTQTFNFLPNEFDAVLASALRQHNPAATGLTNTENADYRQGDASGALTATRGRRNFLEQSTGGTPAIILSGADNPVLFNLNLASTPGGFSLTPAGASGRYSFGNKRSNYGLAQARYYTVSGTILTDSLAAGAASLTLRINGQESTWPLQSGRFEFTFDNQAMLTPAEVSLFIRTSQTLELGLDMALNEGNYRLPATLPAAAASTFTTFDLDGTVSLWYKPLNARADGFVNETVTILDSEYVRLDTVLAADGRAVYRFGLKQADGSCPVLETSAVPVLAGWQHLQLSYSYAESKAYLYVNGQTAARHEGALPISPTMAGLPYGEHRVDNVVLGANLARTSFAEGYLDHVVLERFYRNPLYLELHPLTLSYDAGTDQLVRTMRLGLVEADISSSRYEIRDAAGANQAAGQGLPGSLASLPMGRYRLNLASVINGRNHAASLVFERRAAPRFSLLNRTPVIFLGRAADIFLDFAYDGSSAPLPGAEPLYAALAVRLQYRDAADSPVERAVILAQDFINEDPAAWQLGAIGAGQPAWASLSLDNGGRLPLVFDNLVSLASLTVEYKAFYFDASYDFSGLSYAQLPGAGATAAVTIPLATLMGSIEDSDNEHRIDVTVGSPDNTADAMFVDMEINTLLRGEDGVSLSGPSFKLDSYGRAALFYDDLLPALGEYDCTLRLRYAGEVYAETVIENLVWRLPDTDAPGDSDTTVSLSLEQFDLLRLADNKASLSFEFRQSGVQTLRARLELVQGSSVNLLRTIDVTPNGVENRGFFHDLPVAPGNHLLRLTLTGETGSGSLGDSRELNLSNAGNAPELVLTDTVDSLIAFNNVFIAWRGLLDGQFRQDIQYSYNFDEGGWTTPNADWRSVRLYNLAEGQHTLQIKALHNDQSSPLRIVRFFVDVARPSFVNPATTISLQPVYDSNGVWYAVNVVGAAGCLTDASLNRVTVNGQLASLRADGSFSLSNLPLSRDGVNEFLITAYDDVGNYADYRLQADNSLTSLVHPSGRVRYMPLSMYGSLADTVPAHAQLYVADSSVPSGAVGDFSAWKRARLNEDRSFIVEDIMVNPGSAEREIVTTLRLAVVFPALNGQSRKIFYRDVVVHANQLFMPLELTLSSRAMAGEAAGSLVRIDCAARMDGIAVWSIDFDGDGIYDETDIVDDPASQAARSRSWEHRYSSLGLVRPRVRVLTTDGQFFSASDSLIIHEQVREASSKAVNQALGMSVIRLADGSRNVFVLRKANDSGIIDRYEISADDAFLSNVLSSVNLAALNISQPERLLAIDRQRLVVVANRSGTSTLYLLQANAYGNFAIRAQLSLLEEVASLAGDASRLVLSYKDSVTLVTLPLKPDFSLDTDHVSNADVSIAGARDLGRQSRLALDGQGLLVADTLNQRLVRLGPQWNALDQFGGFGTGEGQFIKPAHLAAYENRIMVWDESRRDIQVFDASFRPITRLAYDSTAGAANFMAANLLTAVSDLSLFAREEGGQLYYYALVLSSSSSLLSMFRLPQWEELRARVRNNSLVFLRDREIYMSKPDGSDLTKLLSSDSLPPVDGLLNYPALAPDGRSLVFLSRLPLFGASGPAAPAASPAGGFQYLYVSDTETKQLRFIALPGLAGSRLERPQFNSNGSKLIFAARPAGGNWQIYVYDLASGALDRLFSSDENARFPYYSPDDRYVVFSTDYSGSENLEIVDTRNTNLRISLTANQTRNSMPVWSSVYPHEISNQDYDVESKIAFVSERDFRKDVYVVYLSRPSESDLRVFDLRHPAQAVGDNPDQAALRLSAGVTEADYPCFTGDGRRLAFESLQGDTQAISQFAFADNMTALSSGAGELSLSTMPLVPGAVRPAGMKNMITGFQVAIQNGNEASLSWNRYTTGDIFYFVQYRPNREGAAHITKKVSSQSGTVLSGLEMGQEYLVRVCIIENGDEVATSQWRSLPVPEVAARPSFQIDPANPYLVRFSAWKPDPDTRWKFSWIIDNQEIPVQNATAFSYEYATSGAKVVTLKASTLGDTATVISEPLQFTIDSDIDPVLEYALAEDASYIELSARNSAGQKIDWANTSWTISGPGRDQIQVLGAEPIVQLNGFQRKIRVSLTLRRLAVSGQPTSDSIAESYLIDLDMPDVQPVITYQRDETDPRLFRFSAEHSLGNIDWFRAGWSIFANAGMIAARDGVSSLSYRFPESNQALDYSVSLTLPRRNDGQTVTVTRLVSVDAAPIEPVIGYQILNLESGGNVIGQKLVLDATSSRGSDIDFMQARWSLPSAGQYGEGSSQVGPTAIFNLSGISQDALLSVSLTLGRRGGGDPVTHTQVIRIAANQLAPAVVKVNREFADATDGQILHLDILGSSGPNIEWERTEWTINGQMARGPAVSYPLPASSTAPVIAYTVLVYCAGTAAPLIERGEIRDIVAQVIVPVIDYVPHGVNNGDTVMELSVRNSGGVNIDWERTLWSIYDGNENVTQLRGSTVIHAFRPREAAMGYPVMVEMFLKDGSKSYVGYRSIDIEGDTFTPDIKHDPDLKNPGTYTFSCAGSTGSGIQWSNARWNFGDGSAPLFGMAVTHHFNVTSTSRQFEVSLTLSRGSGASMETKTVTRLVDFSNDAIRPVIKARMMGSSLYGYTLILSAEDSRGMGLLLDRAIWLFPGSGDVVDHSDTQSISAQAEFSLPFVGGVAVTVSGSESESYSNQNQHVGLVCRRHINRAAISYGLELPVTLSVYRYTEDGSIQGESLTVFIPLAEAAQAAGWSSAE
ncbi:MAG: hypothetical protein A2087_13005 [Spirochaetes bacterium GWD1_61_31]|nr:MAG: hypothetical protein A2087_13005 [Spirochaetes bacterium GWD1_61_31]HAP44401.1 hypothetical protein [Spirochaetaceae bacterium]HCQ86424.1 hypothetical protein [Spirochaetaceae bacterium]